MNAIQDKLGYAMTEGVGTLIIPSPRPEEVQDLVLTPFNWVHVDGLFQKSPHFRKALKAKKFQFTESVDQPESIDLSLNPDFDKDLDAAQRVFVRSVCTQDVNAQMKANIELANLVNESGIPSKDSRVTVAYLRETHRPMLLAIQDLEKRFKKRKALLALVKRQLERIARLPS